MAVLVISLQQGVFAGEGNEATSAQQGIAQNTATLLLPLTGYLNCS
jgi:hypothetical protein